VKTMAKKKFTGLDLLKENWLGAVIGAVIGFFAFEDVGLIIVSALVGATVQGYNRLKR